MSVPATRSFRVRQLWGTCIRASRFAALHALREPMAPLRASSSAALGVGRWADRWDMLCWRTTIRVSRM
eukprot:4092647-Pyramimonas_sp.AAC.1